MNLDSRHQFELSDGNKAERESSLNSLYEAVQKLVPGNVTMLKAAGAIAIRALPSQLRKIVRIPGIKEIRMNRKMSGR